MVPVLIELPVLIKLLGMPHVTNRIANHVHVTSHKKTMTSQATNWSKLPDDWIKADVAPVFRKRGSALSGKLQADIPHMYLCQITRTHHL